MVNECITCNSFGTHIADGLRFCEYCLVEYAKKQQKKLDEDK